MPDGQRVASLYAEIGADVHGFQRGAQTIKTELGRIQTQFKMFGTSISANMRAFDEATGGLSKRMSALGDTLITRVSLPLAGVAALSIKAASDLSESMNKVDVVFGEAADSIRTFARTSARDLGLSRRQALEATGTFGNLFTAMKLGREPAAEMSQGLVKLAADLASFNNIDPTVALEKLRAGIVGETEPLRTLGINLTAATVEAKALAMGLATAGGVISEQAKVSARYALIMEQSTNAQGDFARTADGMANSTRIARAQLEDAAATLGENLLPAANKAIGAVNDLAEAFNNLDEPTQGAIVNLGLIAIAMGPAIKAGGLLIKVLGALGSVLGAAGLGIASGSALLVGVAMKLGLITTKAGEAEQALIESLSNPNVQLKILYGQLKLIEEALKFEPENADLLIEWQQLQIEADKLRAAVQDANNERLDGLTANLHNVESAAWGAVDAVSALARIPAGIETPQGWIGVGTRAKPEQLQPYVGMSAYSQAKFDKSGAWDRALGGMEMESWPDLVRKQEEERTRQGQRLADKQLAAWQKAADEMTGFFKSKFGEAVSFSLGLGSLLPGGDKGPLAPGANGPFESIYRLQDIAIHGTDKSPWDEVLGVGQEQAAGIVRKFQQGIFDAEVTGFIDKGAISEMLNIQQIAEATQQAFAEELAKAGGVSPDVVKGLLGLGGVTEGGQAAGPDMKPAADALVSALGAGLAASENDIAGLGKTLIDGIFASWETNAAAAPWAEALVGQITANLIEYFERQ